MKFIAMGVASTILISAALIAIAFMRRQPADKDRDTYVIGQEMADAADIEQQRIQQNPDLKSPMPQGDYDFWRGEKSLVDLHPLPLDAAIGELCAKFAKSDASSREQIRGSISMDEFYTLLQFGQRSAVLAIREKNPQRVADGLTAISMIELERTDFRDVLVCVALLHHGATRSGANIDQLFHQTANASEPKMSELIVEFMNRSPDSKDVRSLAGYDEIETANGVGFITRDYRTYEPTLEIQKVIIDIAAVIAADKYQPRSIAIGSELPAVWLQSGNDSSVERLVKSARAGATIDGALHPKAHPQALAQQLTVFLVELPDERAAETLLGLSKEKNAMDCAKLGVAERQLFCLVVGRSFMEGASSFETTEKLARFSPGISEVLRRYTKK